MYTRCPHCATVYRVTPQQLQASSGQVRCGRCQAQFDAFASLTSERGGAPGKGPEAGAAPASPASPAPSQSTAAPLSPPPPASSDPVPAASGPVAPAGAQRIVSSPAASAPDEDALAAYVRRYGSGNPGGRDEDAEDAPEEIEALPAAPASSVDQFAESLRVLQTVAKLSLDMDESRPPPHLDQPWVEAVTDTPDPAHARSGARESQAPEAGGNEDESWEAGPRPVTDDPEAQEPDRSEEIALAPPPPASKPAVPVLTVPDSLLESGAAPVRRRGAWIAAIAALTLVLALQALWWFASPVALALPGTRPALESACGLLGCEVALPRLPEQLAIEGSDLQLLDVARPQEVLLTAQVRNRAAVAQQLPSIELTLTNTANQVVGRRVLRPSDYLDPAQRGQRSIGGNEEIAIRLYLNTGDVRAAGYRLYLFFG